MDGWDFKNYVLGTMFYRYISENPTNYINAGEQDVTISYNYIGILPANLLYDIQNGEAA